MEGSDMSELRNLKCRSRAGLTLLELVVVMAILIAIAGILVPLLPDLVGKGNQSASATNMGELEKAIQLFQGEYNRYPNYYDSMISGSEVSGLVPAAGNRGPGGGNLEARPLTKGQVSRLSRRGITMVYDIEDAIPADTSNFHATLNPYEAGTTYGNGRPLAEDETFIVMLARDEDGYNDDVFDKSVMPGVILNPDHDYAVFGIGKYCNLCGPDGVVKEAPIHGQHKAQTSPAEEYSRFCAVYDIGPPDDDTSKVNAKFVGVVAIAGKRLFTAGDIAGRYRDNEFTLTQPPE
jgi:type II secretory pathway pseudopilin PulG